MTTFHSTTIVAVQKNGRIAMAGDGQVTMGETTIMKGTARKVRRLYGDQGCRRLCRFGGRCVYPI